ncbi:MAG: winged helix-turn-helix domain-containing protein [Microbacteriaceae bacterium]
MVTTVSAAQARRIALRAQGFGLPAPAASPGIRSIHRIMRTLRLVQLDSVNVFARSHYLPAFARLGHYDTKNLDALLFDAHSGYTEYWAHEAAVIPIADRPLFQWRMDALRAKHEADQNHWIHSNRPMLDWLRAELASRGPVTAAQIEHDSNKRTGPWWGWSDVKHGLEYLFAWGEVVSAGRARFERRYALANTQLSPAVLNSDIEKSAAIQQLMLEASRAHGIGTLADFADYFRLNQTPARAALTDLVDSGELVPVTVEGWREPAWMHRDAVTPRSVNATALLSPFDPVVWERSRALRLFGFHYRIEIYTPAPRRQFGYYSLPVLVDDTIVGRIDLKSDRKNKVLLVQSAWHEDAVSPEIAARIAPVVREAAGWQGLGDITVTDWGTLAPALAAELGVPLRART